MVDLNPNSIPGIGTTRTATPRNILLTPDGAVYFPSGKVISGANARDPSHANNVDVLRAGLVLGKRYNDNKYAPSILGRLTVAGTAAGATITTDAVVGVELDRRVGAGGLFKVVGPPTDGGTVVIVNTLSYSGQVAGVITLAANSAVAEVQTWTLDSVLTAGTYKLGYKGEWTADIAFDATIAEMQAALLLLSTIKASDVVIEAVHEPDTEVTATLTFVDTLGNVPMVEVDFSKATGPTTWTVAETTPGELVGAATLGADCVIGSLIIAADGSEAPLGLVEAQYGIKVTDADNVTSVDAQIRQLLVGGLIDTSQIIDYPSAEQGVRVWLKAQLRLHGIGFLFDDDF